MNKIYLLVFVQLCASQLFTQPFEYKTQTLPTLSHTQTNERTRASQVSDAPSVIPDSSINADVSLGSTNIPVSANQRALALAAQTSVTDIGSSPAMVANTNIDYSPAMVTTRTPITTVSSVPVYERSVTVTTEAPAIARNRVLESRTIMPEARGAYAVSSSDITPAVKF